MNGTLRVMVELLYPGESRLACTIHTEGAGDGTERRYPGARHDALLPDKVSARETGKAGRGASVVCGVDGSPGSREAARRAHALAEGLRLRLILVYVPPLRVHPMPPHHPPRLALDGLWVRDREAGLRLVEDEAEAAGAEDADRRVEGGDPVERLAAVAAEENAEFLVVGSRGRGPWRAALLGSVSAALAGRAPCPVVVVPYPSEEADADDGERLTAARPGGGIR